MARPVTCSLALALLVLLCAGNAQCRKTSDFPDAPPLSVPDFAVSIDKGSQRLSALLGSNGIAVIFAGYRGCPDICPNSMKHLSAAYDELTPEERARTHLVFLEVGSAAPDLVQEYAHKFHREFATSVDNGSIAKDLQLFVAVAEVGPPRRIAHAGTIILADHKLQTRKRLPHDISADDLKNEIQVLLTEPAVSK